MFGFISTKHLHSTQLLENGGQGELDLLNPIVSFSEAGSHSVIQNHMELTEKPRLDLNLKQSRC